MARHFVDTSALVKHYRNEPQSPAVQACIRQNDVLVLSGIAYLEFQSAFFGLVRQQALSQTHASQRIVLLKQDLTNFEIIPLLQSLVSSAEVLVDRFGIAEGLRPGDALQLTCALAAHGKAPLDSLLTTDPILGRCASVCGLAVKP